MGKYFGTDGFRGEANDVLDARKAYDVGRFIGCNYGAAAGKKAKILIGKDTRLSGYMFEYAICAGIAASGADAYLMHVTTTPSVAYITRADDFDCGVMISASHNAFCDNGIKLLNARGEKLDDETTALIEKYIDAVGENVKNELPYARGKDIGKIVDFVSGRNRYVGYLISLAAHSYRSLKVGLDCANGSAWTIAKAVFDAIGAKTFLTGASPDGTNINRGCGSTHTDNLKSFVLENGLDVGFAYDGDADRCIAVDENGNEVDGDAILYIFARRLKRHGALDKNTVVATVMSNGGLFKALDEAGVSHEKTDVGDRFVYECMTKNGYSLGGEQSGHIILRKYATTGDGLLTSIILCEEMLDEKQPLSALALPVKKFPQKTVNVAVADKDGAVNDEDVLREIESVRRALGENGRVMLRKSGTEPVVRVMVECEDEKKCGDFASHIADVLRRKGY